MEALKLNKSMMEWNYINNEAVSIFRVDYGFLRILDFSLKFIS